MPIEAYLFDAQGQDHEIEIEECIAESIGDKQLLWINARDVSRNELREIASSLDITDKVLEKALNTANGPRLELIDKCIHLRIIAPEMQGIHFKAIKLDIIAGNNYLVAIYKDTIEFLRKFDEETRGDTQLGELDTGTFLVALLNRFINTYFEALDKLSIKVDTLDERALSNQSGQRLLSHIVELRHQVTELRVLLAPHRQIFTTLAGVDFGKMAFGDNTPPFDAVLDRVEKALDSVENTREMVIGSFEVFTSVMAQNTNDSVRLLTVITVVIGLSGVIAGIMGMNFTDISFFKTGLLGFVLVVACMIIVALGVLALAKWRRLY